MAELQCIIVTPEETVLDERGHFVALPLYDGELGVAPGHSPMIGRLGYGELRLIGGGSVHRYYIDGGFVQVVGDVVSVLTSRAIPADELDPAVIAEQLRLAREMPATTPETYQAREKAEAQSRAQLRMAQRGSAPASAGHH